MSKTVITEQFLAFEQNYIEEILSSALEMTKFRAGSSPAPQTLLSSRYYFLLLRIFQIEKLKNI